MNPTISLKTKLYSITLLVLAIAAVAVNYNQHARSSGGGIVLPGVKENDYVAVFTDIYDNNRWHEGSGPGSNPKNAAQYMSLLQQYFDDPNINTIVDLGCGDWQIMRHIRIPTNKNYLGFDVVPKVVAANAAEFTKDNVHFYHITSLKDFVVQNIYGDLLVVKDVLQHWPNSEIEYFLQNVLPNFKYALITNQYIVDQPLHNKNVPMGPAHSVGLLEAPFSLQHAKALMEYDGPDHKQVILYQNPNLA